MEFSIDRQCRACGNDFVAWKSNQQYCSSSCRVRDWHIGERILRVKEIHVCKKCQKEFETHDKRKIFCSKQCRFQYFNSLRSTTKALQRICPQCQKPFIPMQIRGVGKKFCSRVCAKRFNYLKNHSTIKERQVAWHRKNKWDGNWEAALERDKYTCQLCSKILYPSQWEGKRRLEVHHRDGSGGTGNKNHSLENLLTLCLDCHKEFYMKVNLIFVDGKYFVKGKIFEILGLKQVDTI